MLALECNTVPIISPLFSHLLYTILSLPAIKQLSFAQKVSGKKPSKPSHDQKVGDSFSIINKCSDKKRVTEELVNAEKNLYRITTYELFFEKSKCVEKITGGLFREKSSGQSSSQR